jgi:hypothetical protein
MEYIDDSLVDRYRFLYRCEHLQGKNTRHASVCGKFKAPKFGDFSVTRRRETGCNKLPAQERTRATQTVMVSGGAVGNKPRSRHASPPSDPF